MTDNIKKTGTTTLGIVCKDGIVLAADRRVTAGNLIMGKKFRKIIQIDDNVAVTVAGSVSDIQMLLKIIKAQIKLNSLRRGDKRLTIREVSNLLGNLVYNAIRTPSMFPSITGFLVGGQDDTGFHLYMLGIGGDVVEEEDYTADGSGMEFAIGVLENSYKKGMSINEGIKLAADSISASIQRDNASGNGLNVLTITKDGIKMVIEKELETKISL